MLKLSIESILGKIDQGRRMMSSKTMRAIRVHEWGGPEVNKLEEIPMPKYGQNEVLIKIHAVGVNPSETYVRQGWYWKKPPLPYTPGKDSSGVIEAVGSDVKKLKVGDRVFATWKLDGAYAEYAACPQDSCWTLPKGVTFAQGAAVGIPYFTAYRALFQMANAKPGQTVLIHGASGGVGLAATQLARAHGMRVYGTAGTQVGLDLVAQNGAHAVFNHRNEGYQEELMKATDNQGFDLILEMLANINLGKDCELIKLRGTIVVIGSRGDVQIPPRALMQKDARIVGMSLSVTKTDEEWTEMAAAIQAGLESGSLKPVIDQEYPLEKAADAQRDLIESKGAKGNLILRVRPE